MNAAFAAVLVNVVLLAAPEKSKPAQPALHPVESRLLQLTNAERARHGLQPLVLDSQLLRSARRHATWMTNTGNLQHTNQPVAENIAMGQRTSAEAMQSWMSSPGHRANILGNYRRIGIAAFRAPSGTCFWCQQFLH